MFEEQIRHRCAAQAKRHPPKKSVQSAESNQLAVCAGSTRGSRGCNGYGDADYVDGTPAVDVGYRIPEEG